MVVRWTKMALKLNWQPRNIAHLRKWHRMSAINQTSLLLEVVHKWWLLRSRKWRHHTLKLSHRKSTALHPTKNRISLRLQAWSCPTVTRRKFWPSRSKMSRNQRLCTLLWRTMSMHRDHMRDYMPRPLKKISPVIKWCALRKQRLMAL